MVQARKPAGSPGSTGGQFDHDPTSGTAGLPPLGPQTGGDGEAFAATCRKRKPDLSRPFDCRGASLHRYLHRAKAAPGSRFDGADFTGANLSDAQLAECRFDKADFTGADLHGADLHGSFMEDADFTNAYMIKQVNLNGCDLMGARFDGASLNCWLEGADLTDADFTKANFRTANNRLLVDEHTTLDGTLMTWRQAKHVDISGHRNEDPARWLMEHGVVMVGPKPGAHTGTGETHAQRNERIGRETGVPSEDVALAFEGARRTGNGWEVVPPYHTEPVAQGRTREEAVKAALSEAPVMFSADTIRRAWRRHEGW
ncbi:pentapeptide repeat-containing protein [Bifidobacterium porcinum]|uniref:pentapeptide repeat-containing protein n=1 Tax=Bifidobacterium porcinum TaxID=212365 RepID=UPI003996C09A